MGFGERGEGSTPMYEMHGQPIFIPTEPNILPNLFFSEGGLILFPNPQSKEIFCVAFYSSRELILQEKIKKNIPKRLQKAKKDSCQNIFPQKAKVQISFTPHLRECEVYA